MATLEEIEQDGKYIPNLVDWPRDGGVTSVEQTHSYYLRRAREAINDLLSNEALEVFSSVKHIEEFVQIISYPSTLLMIKERIENKFYRHLAALLHDILYIALNAGVIYKNKPVTLRLARALVHTLYQYIKYAF